MTRYRFFRNGVRTMMVILALVGDHLHHTLVRSWR